MQTIGLALGSGGARGLAHIVMIEALDELGVKASAIAGTSIGAVIGVLYAGGLSGAEIKKQIAYLTARPDSIEEAIKEKRLFGWLDFIDLRIGRNSIFRIDKFLEKIEPYTMQIPRGEALLSLVIFRIAFLSASSTSNL